MNGSKRMNGYQTSGETMSKEREIRAGENDKKTQDLHRTVKEQLGIETKIAGKGCLKMTAGEAMKVVEFFEKKERQ